MRPVCNAVLRRLDEGLAKAEHLDTSLCLGLSYPVDRVALLKQSGLAERCEATKSLYEALGELASHLAAALR